MARRGMIAIGLLALLVVAGGVVMMTEGARLLLAARVLVWYGPDNAARAWETYTRPGMLRHALALGSDHRIAGWPRVRWLLWKDRLAALREPVWRRKEMAWALGLGGGLIVLALLRATRGLLGALWFLLRGVGRLTPGTTAGSARWATAAEARRMYGPRWTLLRRMGLLAREAPFVVGRVGRHTLSLSARRQNLNILALGVPGEGKTAATVIPGLLREGERGRTRRSLIVADPKGENYKTAGAVLAARGYRVARLDFYDTSEDAPGYNPLAHIHTASEALVFAQSWIANTRGQGEVSGSDAFWDSTGYLLLQAGILHLNDQYRTRTGKAAPLAQLRALFNTESWDALRDELLHSPCPQAVEAIRGFMGGIEMVPRVGGSALVGLIVKFSVLNDPAIARVTAHDDIDITAISDPTVAPLALFVILTPGRENVLRPLTGSLFMQMFDELVDIANAQPDQKLKRGLFCYLDEAGTIGVIPGLPERLATLRSAGAPMLLACQDSIQLDRLYTPEGRRIITSVCQCHLIFGGVGQEDAAWVSARLGTSTVVGNSANAGRRRGEVFVDQGGYTRGETGRPLLTPEEIQQLPEGWLILNGLHARPVLVRAQPWYRSRALRRLVDKSTARAVAGAAPMVQASTTEAITGTRARADKREKERKAAVFQFDIMTIRPLLDALYLNGLDLYPDDFARLIQASAPTKAQVAQALGGSLGEMATHQAILTNELSDLDNRERRKGSRPQGEIAHVQARANQAAEGLVLATLAVMRRHRAILIGQYQADYEGRHPEYTVNWPGTEGGVPQLGEHDDEPNPFTATRD